MKTKIFPLFAFLAAAVTCFTDAYLMLFQTGATSQAQVTPRVELLLAMFAVGNLLFAVFFFGFFMEEKIWTKLKGFYLIASVITVVSCLYYVAFALVYGGSNTALKTNLGNQMGIVAASFTYLIIIYLVVIFMLDFKNILLKYSILTTLCMAFIFKAIINNLNVTEPTTGATFGYVLVKTSFIPDIILALMFAVMFITMIMPESSERIIVEEPLEELPIEDVIVDDYEVEDEEETTDETEK